MVAAVGVGLLVAAASMPDSVWKETWRDVRVKTADTQQVVFRKEPNGSKQGLGVIAILGMILGLGLVLMAASSKQ